MPNRSYNNNSYRYGLSNGQEKDNEIFEGAFTAEYWEYDSRTGRRWNLDPVDQISESNYSCFGNNPIMNTDVNGDFKTKFGANVYKFFHGGEVYQDKGGEYGVNQNEIKDGEIINRPRVFDWSGRSEGRDLQREANIAKVKDMLAWDKELDDPKSMYSRDVTPEQGEKNAVNLGLSLFVNSPLTTSSTVLELKTAEGVYDLTLKSGERYIGQSKDILKRILQHFAKGKKGKLNYTALESQVLHAMPGSSITEREAYETYLILKIGIENLKNIKIPMGGRMQEYEAMIEGVISKFGLPK